MRTPAGRHRLASYLGESEFIVLPPEVLFSKRPQMPETGNAYAPSVNVSGLSLIADRCQAQNRFWNVFLPLVGKFTYFQGEQEARIVNFCVAELRSEPVLRPEVYSRIILLRSPPQQVAAMFTKSELPLAMLLLAFSTLAVAQQKTSSALAAAQEFPVTFQQTITAGKTPAGTKVQAKLGMATLVNGTVIPQGATFSGEVVDSVAKAKTDPSKLAIRFDSAQWKSGSATLKVYLVGWFYPFVAEPGQNLQYGPQEPSTRTWNGQGEYPTQNSSVYRPFPSGGSDSNSSPDTSNSTTSLHRVQMKNVETDRGTDGTITLVSSHSNIKLDKAVTYVLASSELLANSAKHPAKK